MGNFQYTPPKNASASSEDLLNDLKVAAEKLGERKLSQNLYVKNGGKYYPSTISMRFETWNKALSKAGLELSHIINYSDEKLFENILNIWQHKGKQPVLRDLARRVCL